MNNLNYSNFSIKINGCSKVCLIHIFMYFSISLFFLLNFIFTYGNFDENKFITMKSDLICHLFIKEHNECLNNFRNKSSPKEIIDECVGTNLRLQMCYDKVQLYNEKCFVYFSEFEKCVHTKIKESNKGEILRTLCKSEEDDINNCTSDFVTFDPFLLLNLKIQP